MEEQKNFIVHSLNPRELIAWCNERCREKKISRTRLSDETGVPDSTLDRILSGRNPEFRYSTIQPVISYLIEYNEDTPQPDRKDDNQGEYYYKTIEGYKLIVENKNHLIEEYESVIRKLEKEISFLKTENDRKTVIIDNLQSHVKWMENVALH